MALASASVPRPFWLALMAFLASTLIGFLNAGIVLTSELAEHEDVSWAKPLVVELSGSYTAVLLLPFLVVAARRFPLDRTTWARRLPLHVAFSMAFGVTHTLLMWGSRVLLFDLLGWGRFEYGRMTYRFLMEYQKQAVVYALVLGVVALVDFRERAHRRELRTVELERQLGEARLSALRLQLNPHFLFNALNMIASHVREKPGVAEAMLGHLADYLRLLLRQSGDAEVPLGKELELTEAYLSIMRARFEESLLVEMRVPEPERRVLVPQLLLQPLVENAVTHGAREPGKPAVVRVRASREGGALRLVVEDEGPGVAEGGPRGVGLTNTAERLRTLHGEAGTLSLESPSGGGLRVVVSLPWRESGVEAPA